jgi:hypothetical protein
MTDLCTVKQVKDEIDLSTDLHDTRIAYMITRVSNDIVHNAKDGESLTSDDYWANMACIYGVLTWMEMEGRIKSPTVRKTITKESDGDFTYEYKSSGSRGNSEMTKSYGERFEIFLAHLEALPCAGSYNDRCGSHVIRN